MADENLMALAANIVVAYVANNSVPRGVLPNAIAAVHATLNQLASTQPAPIVHAPQEPAVPIRKSVTPDFLICLEDGKKFKSLKRHLRSAFGMSPDEYRVKWGLKSDYPMVAPAYAEKRSTLAKSIGLGRQRGTANRKKK